MALCVILVPVFFSSCVHVYVLLFGDSEHFFVILVAPDMLPGPPQWCVLECHPCCLKEVKVFGKGVAIPGFKALV